MKIYLFVSLLIILFYSCNHRKSSNKKSQNIDTLIRIEHDTLENKRLSNNSKLILVKDTIIIFSIDELSSESSEVKAHYINDTIRDAIWKIFGETGQWVINYTFLKNGPVKVQEKQYGYKTTFTEVNSEKDMKLKSSKRYFIDTTGLLLSKNKDKDFINIFIDFKQNVPLILSGSKW